MNEDKKRMGNTSTLEAKQTTSDIKVYGNPDVWVLICKASSEEQGWMKSTKAMQLPNGVVFQMSEQYLGQVATTSCFVPNVKISDFNQQ